MNSMNSRNPIKGMIRVAYFNYSSEITGPGNSMIQLLKGLDRSLYYPIAICPSEGLLVEKLKEIGVEVKIIKMLHLHKTYNPFEFIHYLIHFFSAIFHIALFLKRKKIHIVHIQTIVNIYPGFAARLVGIPVVWHVREILPKSFFNDLYLKLITFLSTEIICVSRAVETRIRECMISQKPLIVINNGIDLEECQGYTPEEVRKELGISNGAKIITSVGTIIPLKGHDILIRAAKKVLENGKNNVTFLIIGGPSKISHDIYLKQNRYLQHLKDLACNLGIAENVIFTGFQQDIHKFYSITDILVLASTMPDSYPRTLLEAQATGIPTVGSNIGGIPECIHHGKTGFLFPPGDVDSLTQRITELIQDEALAAQMGKLGRERIEKYFNHNIHSQEVMDVYHHVFHPSTSLSKNIRRKYTALAEKWMGQEIVCSVSVIVLNWNGRHLLADCLNSLRAQTHKDFEIIVIDNGSTDGSLEFLEENFPEVKVLPLTGNTGFCVGNNEGIKRVKSKYVALLNNDTRVDKDWLKKLVSAMENNPDVGFCTSKILWWDRPDVIDSAGDCFFFHGVAGKRGWLEKDSERYSVQEYVFCACGAASLYRKEMLDHIGCFDEAFFAYNEDVDLSFRAQLMGYKCMYVPSAIVYHKVSSTAALLPDFSLYHIRKNAAYVVIKNMPVRLLLRNLPSILGYYLLGDLKFLLKGKIGMVLKSRYDLMKNFTSLWKKRREIQKKRKAEDQYIQSLFYKKLRV